VTDLRKEARGRDCQVRIPGVCNFNAETSVLAHARLAGLTGTGMKAPDVMAAIACSACHDEIDGRTRLLEREFVRTCFYEGVLRTLGVWVREGLVRW
jgi:hypothetical protein